MNRLPRIAVVADLGNNLVDGSVVWLRNTLLALTGDGTRQHVTFLLRDDQQPDSVLFPPGAGFPGCEILAPADLSRIDTQPCAALTAGRLALLVELVEARDGAFDTILVRGTAFAMALLASPRLRHKTVVYTTERPDFASIVATPYERALVEHAKHILVQNVVQKRYFEVYLQAGPGRVSEFPPMVALPELDTAALEGLAAAKPAALSYAGKLDAQYCVEELVDLAPALRELGFAVEVMGNKFNRAPGDPEFIERLTRKLEATPGVDWRRGVPHEEAQARMRGVRFGWCVRSEAMDNSIEFSTKLLEYSAQGTPPILRRTRQHVGLFGDDYPYFAATPQEVLELLRRNPAPDARYRDAVARALAVARRFDIRAASDRLEPLRRCEPGVAAPAAAGARRRLLVATHDDKFLVAALRRLEERPDLEIRHQRWKNPRVPPDEGPEAQSAWPEVVFCEWCCAQAVWWSRNKAPGQRLIVRLHRFEAFEPHPREVDWRAVDALIVVSDHFRELAIREFGVPASIIHVLPQYVDTAEFDRPKLARASRTVGLVGINALAHKRPDRAIDYLERLVARDPRFTLRIRSRLPWEYGWVWVGRPHERQAFTELFRRCMEPPLARHVQFDRAGNDMGEWFRSVDFILSSSDTEGCHTSVAEGMAAGCWPVCWAWPGAASVYGAEHVHDSVDAMVEATLAAAERLERGGAPAIKEAARRFDIQVSTDLFWTLIR